MKKIIIPCALVAVLALPAFSEDVKPLTQEQIEQILDEAEKDGFKVRPDRVDGRGSGTDNPMVIRPDKIDMFSDTEVYCNDTERLGTGPTIIPLDKKGAPDPDQLPEHCTLKHKLVARQKIPEAPQPVLDNVPKPEVREQMKTLSNTDTVDEPAPVE